MWDETIIKTESIYHRDFIFSQSSKENNVGIRIVIIDLIKPYTFIQRIFPKELIN